MVRKCPRARLAFESAADAVSSAFRSTIVNVSSLTAAQLSATRSAFPGDVFCAKLLFMTASQYVRVHHSAVNNVITQFANRRVSQMKNEKLQRLRHEK